VYNIFRVFIKSITVFTSPRLTLTDQEFEKWMKRRKRMNETPYGGKLKFCLPGGTQVTVHLKDKTKIRARKRWSQVLQNKITIRLHTSINFLEVNSSVLSAEIVVF